MKTTKELIDNYINYAILHGEGTESGDYRKANHAHDQLIKVYKELKLKDPKLSCLKPLVKHDNNSVKAWAATHLLPVDEKLALSILEQLSKMNSFIGLDAEMVIESWKSGTLKLDY